MQNAELIEPLFAKAYQLYENKQYAQAFTIYKKMVELGDDESLNNLAIMYEMGYGVTQDLSKAIALYQEGWQKTQQTMFCLNLANLHHKNGEEQLAIDWWQKAIENGDDSGTFELVKYLLSKPHPNFLAIKQMLQPIIGSNTLCLADSEQAEILLKQITKKLHQ